MAKCIHDSKALDCVECKLDKINESLKPRCFISVEFFDIGLAPKDGTILLLWSKKLGTITGLWQTPNGLNLDLEIVEILEKNHGGWYSDSIGWLDVYFTPEKFAFMPTL